MEDFLTKKKDSAPILDLSKTVANTKEEFKKLLEKVPDFKIKPEKVSIESLKIKDKRFKFKTSKKDLKVSKESFTFMNPLPREMRNIKIKDLAAVPIDWKMLTTLRPKVKYEENYFSRLVELKKLENKNRDQEKRHYATNPQIRKSKNKAGVIEIRVVCCLDCGEDFCNGKQCSKFTYDSCARDPEVPTEVPKIPLKVVKGVKHKKKLKKSISSKSKVKKKEKKKKSQKREVCTSKEKKQ